MTRRDLEEMLRKLQAMGDDSDSPESKNALAIRKKLMAQHGVTEEQIGKRDWRSVKVAPGTEIIAVAVADWMKLDLRGQRQRRRKWKAELLASTREAKLFTDLYNYSKQQLRAIQRTMRSQVKGWLLGHLQGLYPKPLRNLPCPKCGAEGWGNYIDRASRRIACQACGHKGDKLDFDPDAYFLARAMAHPALPGPAAGATPPPQIETEPPSCGNCKFANRRCYGYTFALCWSVRSPMAGKGVEPDGVCKAHEWSREPQAASRVTYFVREA
ncbi:MAG TPA: DUF2786 domain-containing protein [Planctomycetota bacterium]|nr:DUF2786 domain-containing protein [Planctomycetota bacterium]